MYAVLLVIHVIVSLFLIFVILVQSSKGEGLSDVFGGGGSSQTTIFGTRTGTFLTKATTASAMIFMVTCLSLAFLSKQRGGSVVQQELIKEQAVEKVQEMMDKDEESEEKAARKADEAAMNANEAAINEAEMNEAEMPMGEEAASE